MSYIPMRRCIHCNRPIMLHTQYGWVHRANHAGAKSMRDRRCLGLDTEATPEPDRA